MQVATRLESLWDEFGEVVARDDKNRAYELRSEILDLQSTEGKSQRRWSWQAVCNLLHINPFRGLLLWPLHEKEDEEDKKAAGEATDQVFKGLKRLTSLDLLMRGLTPNVILWFIHSWKLAFFH